MAKLERPTRRMCLYLWTEDCDEIERMVSPDMNFSEIVRGALHEFVRHARDRMSKRLDTLAGE